MIQSSFSDLVRHSDFFNINLRRGATVIKSNIRTHRLYEKCEEGTKRKSKYKNGRYVNIDVYAILKKEHLTKYYLNIPKGRALITAVYLSC